MTALSADPAGTSNPSIRPLVRSSPRDIYSGEIMYYGAAASIGTPTNGTAGKKGLVEAWAGTSGQFLLGLNERGATTGVGDAALAPAGSTQILVDDVVLENVAVAGLASSSFQADCLKYVYLGDDNVPASLTLTRPAAPNRMPVGMVWRGKTAAVCDVLWFGVRTRLAMAMNGGPVKDLFIGVFGIGITGSGNLLTGIQLNGHGKILDTYAIAVHSPTDVDVDVDVNLEIGGVDVTGGVIECVTADAVGDKKAGTAITAANEFHDGDLLDVEGVVNTAGTAADPGVYNLHIVVEYLPGL